MFFVVHAILEIDDDGGVANHGRDSWDDRFDRVSFHAAKYDVTGPSLGGAACGEIALKLKVF
jgi:hypothetical protein